MIENDDYIELENFLAGTFHQDIEDPMKELKEYIEEVGNENLLCVSKEIEYFLKSDLSDEYKEEFIQENTFIYFPAIGFKPTEWLIYVLEEMKKVI